MYRLYFVRCFIPLGLRLPTIQQKVVQLAEQYDFSLQKSNRVTKQTGSFSPPPS